MEIVPLLHIKDDQPVVGRPGAWEPAPAPYPDGGNDLAGLARHLGVRFGSVCLVDLGTGRSDEPHLNLYQRLVKQNVPLWIDAFPERLEDVMDLFVAGAERVTIRLDRFDRRDLEDVIDMAEAEIWLGLPFRELRELDDLIRKTAPHEALRNGAAGSVLIDLAAAGTARGPDPDLLGHAPREGAKYVAGGIGTPEDADRWAHWGADGVLVGSAVWKDIDTWAKKAQGELDDGPRVVGTSSADASVVVDQRSSWLPGVLPDRPANPHVERDER